MVACWCLRNTTITLMKTLLWLGILNYCTCTIDSDRRCFDLCLLKWTSMSFILKLGRNLVLLLFMYDSWYKRFICFYFMGISICLYVCVPHAFSAYRGQKKVLVADGCELSLRCWESNPGPLQEQPVHLTMEPSFYSWSLVFWVTSLLVLGLQKC